MPGRAPRITGQQMLWALERAGWERVHQVGSHIQLRHPARAGRVTVPIHRGRTLRPELLANILRQAGLDVEQLRALLEEVAVREYTIVLTSDPDGGGYTITVPALPGCFTQGDTEEEALANAREAIRCHLEGLRLDGQPIPDRDVTPRILKIEVPDPAAA